jgi:hypothetical protein
MNTENKKVEQRGSITNAKNEFLNKKIDISNESLEDAASNNQFYNERDTYEFNAIELYQKLKDEFIKGANWQKEKDKAIIDKALELLNWAHKVINASVPKKPGHGAIEILPQIEQLLNQLQK